MNEVPTPIGLHLPVSAAFQALVRAGQEQFSFRFPEAHQCFDAAVWDVRAHNDRPLVNSNTSLYFTRFGTADQVLPPVYAQAVKSWIILDWRSVSTMVVRCEVARVLWEAILMRRRNDSTAFHWQDLCEEDLGQAELFMQQHWAQSTTYQRGNHLLGMVHFLATRGICRPLYYVLHTPRIDDFHRHTIAGQEERRSKLPSPKALEGVADIYRIHAIVPGDRLRACALAILAVTGFRVGELLTLPLDCEVTEISGGKTRYGLRYYKEKALGAEKMFDVRWLTATGGDLARKAITDIRAITAQARERAKILEQNPSRVPLPGYDWSDQMSPKEVTKILGLKRDTSVYGLARDKVPLHERNGKSFFLAGEVEAYLLSERVPYLWTVDRKDGTYQMLSETLFIAFQRSFKPRDEANPLLVEPLKFGPIKGFLTGAKSAFERFGIREADGTVCKMNSHQFRHWLNDIADKGGLPVDLQSRWLGREQSQDTHAYRHATVDERLQWVKNGIRNHEVGGTIATVYFALPENERDVFLEGHIQAVHFTPMGTCIHDFAITPCPLYLNCARNCPDYLRTKGNQQERQNLIQIQRRTKQALEIAKTQVSVGNAEPAQAWVQEYEETLAGVEAALAIDDDVTLSDGTMVQPFPNDPSRFQPL